MERQARLMRIFLYALIPFWLVLGPSAGHGELVDRIAAIVNDDVITLSEWDETVQPYAGQIRRSLYGPQEKDEVFSRLRQDVLNRMIDQKLTDQESQRLGVDVDESEVDERIEQMMAAQSVSKEDLEKALQDQGYSQEEYRQRIREQMLRMKLINLEVKSKIAITEEEIEEYYDQHKEDYQEQRRYHLRTILVRVSSSDTAQQKGEALKRIEAAVEAFEAGVGFEELAERYSDDRTAKGGGDLGLFDLEELSPEFRETVRGMKEGEISPIMQTPQGYQVVMLEQIKREEGKSLEETKLQIQDKLYNELVEKEYKAWLEELRARSYIQIID
ncbi:MAG: SurA N-terminal domain-containing protein [Thermodesulfobacteriota bacterium]|nr:SurA N-terminal domain-containing protein [Thermodesulfobacteriota bacterium]